MQASARGERVELWHSLNMRQTHTGGGWAVGWLIGTTLLAFAGRGLAASDDCVSATPVGEGVFSYDTRTATDDGPNPCSSVGSRNVWLAYTASVSGTTVISTCASDFHADDQQSVIAVYSGTCAAPIEVACSFSGCGLGSTATFPASAGTTYLVQVGGGCGECTSSGVVVIASTSIAPANDHCSDAQVVGPGVHSLSNIGATLDAPGTSSCASLVGDIWYLFTPASSGLAEIKTCGSAFDTVLTVFDGSSCAPLASELACSDDDCRAQSTLLTPVVGGQSYLIQVAGSAGAVRDPAQGVGRLSIHVLNPPMNDECANASSIREGRWPLTNTDATTDGPQDCEDAARDVWFQYTPSITGLATITARGFDSVVAAYDGCQTLSQLACNNDYASVEATIALRVVAGEPVLIMVGGNGGVEGSGTLDVRADPAPANDDCDSAITITTGAHPFSSRGASTDGPTPQCILPTDQIYNDIWFRLVAPLAGDITVSLCGSLFDTVLAVYSGACPDATSTELACDDDSCGDLGPSTVTVHGVHAGQTLLIRVGGVFSGFVGEGMISVQVHPACALAPAPGSFIENEECGEDRNGGCAGDGVSFELLTCAPSQTLFGSLNTDAGIRDTDWYRVTLTQPATLTFGGQAEFPAFFSIRGGVCQGDELARAVVRGPCEAASFCSIRVPAGNYNLTVVPNDFWSGASCSTGSDYLATLTITCDPSGACCMPGACEIRTLADCSAAAGIYRGDNTACDRTQYLAATCEATIEDIADTGAPGPQCDACEVRVPIGFAFRFFGEVHTSLWINANGFLSFGPVGRMGNSPHPVPRNWNPNAIIAPFWTDLASFLDGSIVWETRGGPGRRRFIAQWTNVPRAFDVDQNTFQVVLHELDGSIDFRYGAVSASPFPDQTVIGVENSDGTVASTFSSSSPLSNTCLHWQVLRGPDPCCPADFNGSGSTTVQDIFDFLAAYFTGNGLADFNGVGGVTVQDVFDFLAAWFAGC